MVLLPLVVVIFVVGVVYATRRRRHLVSTGPGSSATVAPADAISPVGRTSLVVLAAAVGVWALTYSAWPIYAAAAIAGIAFLLAVYAVVVRHDRSPLLLLPLLVVPLAAVASVAFVVLQ
jgi:hypothetical protein